MIDSFAYMDWNKRLSGDGYEPDVPREYTHSRLKVWRIDPNQRSIGEYTLRGYAVSSDEVDDE